MSNSIINNSYMVGVAGKNLVLQTLGRVYIKVNDSYHELKFGDSVVNNDGDAENLPDIYIVNTEEDAKSMTYPGDNKLIISQDGGLFYTTGGRILKWEVKIPSQSLTLDNLTINGVLTVNNPNGTPLVLNGGQGYPPIIINTNELISNLNAEYLNGYTAADFLRRNENAIINGSWTFNSGITIDYISNLGETTVLDLANGILTIDTIRVKNLITDADALTQIIRGMKLGETWVSPEITFTSYAPSNDDDDGDTDEINYFDNVELAYGNYLPSELNDDDSTEVEITVWFNVFFSDYYDGMEGDDVIPTIRDLTLESEQDTANTYLAPYNLDVTDYLDVYYSFVFDPGIFSGEIFMLEVASASITFNMVQPNDIVKSYDGNWYAVVKIVSDESIIIQMLNDEQESIDENSMGIVVVGNTRNPNRQGRVVIDLLDPLNPFIDLVTSPFYSTINNDTVILRLGNFNSLYTDPIFGELSNSGLFLNGFSQRTLQLENFTADDIRAFAKRNHSQIFIKNPNISFGTSTLFNPDGSGMISDGRIRWTTEKLIIDNAVVNISEIDGATITNSTIDQATFDDSNLTAGGDLTGTYPNPTIADDAVTPDKLDRAYLEISGGDLEGDLSAPNINVTGTLSINGVNKTDEINSIDISGDGTKIKTDDGTYKPISDFLNVSKAYRGDISTTNDTLEIIIGSFIFGITKYDASNVRAYIRSANGDITASWRRASIYDGSSEGSNGNSITLTDATNVVVDGTIYTNSQDNGIVYLSTADELHRIEVWVSDGGADTKIIANTISSEELQPITTSLPFDASAQEYVNSNN